MGVHNGAAVLAPTLESILSQRGVDLEFIVVDDGSTDTTWQSLEKWATDEPRLRLHRMPHSGLTRALIEGCALARGEFIARQDVGDLSLPGRLQKQMAMLAAQAHLTFVACQFVSVGPGGETLGDPQPSDGGRAIVASLQEASETGMECPHHGSVLFRRSAYDRVGGYRPEFFFAQDLDLWSRLIEVGDFEFVREPLYQSSFAPGALSARYRAEQLLMRDLIREATLRRRRGETDDPVLQKASLIRPGRDKNTLQLDAAADYFIGSRLLQRGDKAATHYLLRAAKSNPLHLKAWAKLLLSKVRYSP
jgi:glycosyltransferase involved in cell wall biosynthesis